MPCSDVTEELRIELDPQDRLRGYELIKRTCGRAVGERSLMAEAFVGQPAAELLAISAEDFAHDHDVADETEMFLRFKHLFALQAGLRVMLGHQSGSATDPLRVARVSCHDDLTFLEAEISVDVIAEEIKACGKCKGCGTFSAKLKAAAGAPGSGVGQHGE